MKGSRDTSNNHFEASIYQHKKTHYQTYKKTEYSYSIIVPKEIIDKYGWREKQKLTVEDKGRGRPEVKDWRNK